MRTDLDRHQRQVQEYGERQARVLGAVVAFLNHPAVPATDPDDAPTERLITALGTGFALPSTAVEIGVTDSGQLAFTFENETDGAWTLGALAWRLRGEPHLLPGVLTCIETFTARSEPCFGPAGLEAHAEYHWNLDRLSKELYERLSIEGDAARNDRLERALGNRHTALTLARRLNLTHEYTLRDHFPYPLFERRLTPDQTLDALWDQARRGPRLSAALTSLADALNALRQAHNSLPVMTEAEAEAVCGVPLITRLYTTQAEDQPCPATDLANEFMDYHWQGGEPHAFYALHLTPDPASAARLVTYLQGLPRAHEAMRRVGGELELAQSLCESGGHCAGLTA
ncbi:hypothetical protein DEFR109230_16935 [Deinococcus frigens]|uniref:hypothetical protein n=1 Tax=Deinococcus frigens TaxID=249403 RepID=UPI000496BA38|nr:hypothetical protein [Deinococcus frigens]